LTLTLTLTATATWPISAAVQAVGDSLCYLAHGHVHVAVAVNAHVNAHVDRKVVLKAERTSNRPY